MVEMKPITTFYLTAWNAIIPEYQWEIDHVREVLNKPLNSLNRDDFFRHYVYVVLCSYWKEQYARREWELYLKTGNLNAISNNRKREAVSIAVDNAEKWLEELKIAQDPIEYLDTLPMIGPVTRYHLARNIGIDCVKPDRHLIRIAHDFNYFCVNHPEAIAEMVEKMCIDIRDDLGGTEKLGVIDVVLWRYCNIYGSK